MDEILKLFLNNEEVKDSKIREKYGIISSTTGIIVNILLSIIKLIIGIIANSISIISDALNNITDVWSSVVTLIGFKMSQKKIDKEHPWGHGRMEYITAFIVDLIILMVGVELLKSSIEKIIHPELPYVNNITIIVLILAVLTKLWLFFFYRKISKIINSNSIKGNAYDSVSDAASTFVVLISIIIAKIFKIAIDGYASLLVSIFILITGYKAIKETIDLLLGSKPNPEFVKEIENECKNYKLVSGIHDIMVHDYGPGRKIVSFHAEVPAEGDICKVHEVIDKMEQDLYDKFNCIITIHMDPVVVDNIEVNDTKKLVENIVKEIDNKFSIHDFRMTIGEEKSNLIFDLVVPRDKEYNYDDIKNRVNKKIREKNNKYNAVIRVETSYI